ncbi:MAG: putative porin, partial [Bacteroidota bacterium]
NIGENYRSLSPFQAPVESGFDYGIHSFDQYLYQNDSVKYYKVYKTYTELTYVQGAKKEQNFHAIFSRNIYRSFNLGFDFRVMNPPGAYVRQRTNHINFVITSQFFTKDKRYGLIANFTINRLRNFENGGITHESIFENNQESNRLVIPVHLENAQNNIKETGFYMKHYFNLSRHARNDKDTAFSNRKRFELGRLTYSFRYNRQSQTYIDNQPDSGFYPAPVLDTLRTYDSVAVSKIVNEIVWSNPTFNPKNKLRILQLEAGIRSEYNEVYLHGRKNFFNQFIPHAEVDFTPFPSMRLTGRCDYVFGNYNEGDKSLRLKLVSILGRQDKNIGIITITGNYIFQKPGWFYEHYLGNSYRWDTAWQKQGVISAGFNYTWRFLEAGVDFSTISNFVYLDATSQPRQNRSNFEHMHLYLNTDLDIWHFKVKSQLAYQTVQGTSVLRLPAFIGNIALYFTQPIFKRAATLQPGLNFFYNTYYYADNYNPATRSFYLQDRREIGNYLYMDFFINLKIQRARFFVSYSHLNASFMTRDYYTTPYYPMQDAAFKFGIAWRFHD